MKLIASLEVFWDGLTPEGQLILLLHALEQILRGCKRELGVEHSVRSSTSILVTLDITTSSTEIPSNCTCRFTLTSCREDQKGRRGKREVPKIPFEISKPLTSFYVFSFVFVILEIFHPNALLKV